MENIIFSDKYRLGLPKAPIGERVVGERGRNDLPPGTKGGEIMTPERHYEHKQHTFDSYCKKVLKCEAWNGYREISRRQKREVPFSELPEESMEQLAAWDRYPWEYTPFPVGNDVILIEDDRLADALNALPPNDRDIFLMFWSNVLVFGNGGPRDQRDHAHGPSNGQHPQAEGLSAAD